MPSNTNPLDGSKMIYLFAYVRDLIASRMFYEQKLGFRVVEEDADSVKYDAGEIMLALNRAGDHGVQITGAPDDTSIIVFHVDDVDVMRAALEKRGVEFSGPTVRYDIGATAAFYDPDGHCFGLYEASPMAMRWPSATRIRAILQEPAGPARSTAAPLTLGARKMIYLFLFVRNAAEAREFYAQTLGLPIVEEAPDGTVAKYDAGGVLLASHLVASEEGARATPEDLKRPRSIAPVFTASNVQSAVETLARRNVRVVAGPIQSTIGTVARFEDPSGHMFYLYEPSAEALQWPSGKRIQGIPAQPV